MQNVRKFIDSSFEDISCALLPFPGKKIAGTGKARNGIVEAPSNGCWKDMDEDFMEELKILIERLLNPDKLVLKKIDGKELDGANLKGFIETYLKLFQSDDLPPAQSIYESTVEKKNSLIVNECLEHYKETIFINQGLINNVDQIPIFHEMSKNKALVMFKEKKKMGNAEHEKKKFKEVLEAQIEKFYESWKDQSASGIEKFNEEKEKTKKDLEEKDRLAAEQLENVKNAAQNLIDLEKLKIENRITEEKYKHEKEISMVRLKSEQDRSEALINLMNAQVEFTRQLNSQLQSSLEHERSRKKCSIL